MKPGEVISVQHDNNRRGLPREYEARKGGRRSGGPAVWKGPPAVDFEPCRAVRCRRQDIVHLCSGSIPKGEGALRVDIRPEVLPDLVADCRALPRASESAAAVMIDPPYTVECAEDLYDTDYPRPSALLAEACLIAVPGAPIGILHFLVPLPPGGRQD
jgi:hypothetical protein